MREDDAGNFGEFFAGAGLERVAAGVEEHVGHIDDEAAGGVARLQNGIQLAEQLGARRRRRLAALPAACGGLRPWRFRLAGELARLPGGAELQLRHRRGPWLRVLRRLSCPRRFLRWRLLRLFASRP